MQTSNQPLPWKILSEETAHQNPWFSILKKETITPSGNSAAYYMVSANDGVMCVCVTPDQKVLIERQFRPPIGGISVDYPAGSVEPYDTDAETAMKRELQEETGFRAEKVTKLASIDKDPGMATSKMHIFLVEGVVAGQASPEDSESIVSDFVSPETVLRMVKTGEMSCAFCVSATLFAFTKLGWLKS